MIIGSMDTLDENHVDYPAIIQKALAFLREHDFTQMEDGKYPIEGDKCFANLQRYNTRPETDCKPEMTFDSIFPARGSSYSLHRNAG